MAAKKQRGSFKDDFGSIPPSPKKEGAFDPTDEQAAALDLFNDGASFAIEAGAGTGKTSTLKLLADTPRARQGIGQYVAFNKSIVDEAGRKFPGHVACNTAHSLAFRAVGKQYAHRLNSQRMRSSEIAERLGLHRMAFNCGGSPKNLTPGYLAGHVMRAIERFCQTVDQELSVRHFPYIDGIDMPEADGRRTWENNNLVADELLDAAQHAWQDIKRHDGQLTFKHSHYLKLWQLGEPTIPVDYILFDEVQDADPVMADVVLRQKHAQIVLVGDSCQEIYAWRGAVNAFGLFDLEHTTYLTQSFRFGNEIAGVANKVLATLDTPLRLKGLETAPGRIGKVDLPDAILTRTNSNSVRAVLELQQMGIDVCLMGGGKEILAFARAANDLRMRGFTAHPELACFDTWEEVGEYVQNDPQGSELKLNYDLVEEFGVDVIEQALARMPRENDEGVVTVSTAHKAKGREWGRVILGPDFAPRRSLVEDAMIRPGDEEHRLLYVAVTRARQELDISAVPQLQDDFAGYDDADIEW